LNIFEHLRTSSNITLRLPFHRSASKGFERFKQLRTPSRGLEELRPASSGIGQLRSKSFERLREALREGLREVLEEHSEASSREELREENLKGLREELRKGLREELREALQDELERRGSRSFDELRAASNSFEQLRTAFLEERRRRFEEPRTVPKVVNTVEEL